MSKKVMFFTVIAAITVILSYSLSPLIRSSYVSWQHSKETVQRSKPKSFKITVPAGSVDAEVRFKAVGFNRVAFRVDLEPFTEENLNILTKAASGGYQIYLSLKDADNFALEHIGFLDPRRLVNDKGEVEAICFEDTKDMDFQVLDRIAKVDISILEYREKKLKE